MGGADVGNADLSTECGQRVSGTVQCNELGVGESFPIGKNISKCFATHPDLWE